MTTYAMYVRSCKATPYAEEIAAGLKPLETRTRDTLGQVVGNRVLIIRTGRGRSAVVGSVTVTGKAWYTAAELDNLRSMTRIPAGSAYDCKGIGKWAYSCADPVSFAAVPLASLNVLRRTRSFAVIDVNPDQFKMEVK